MRGRRTCGKRALFVTSRLSKTFTGNPTRGRRKFGRKPARLNLNMWHGQSLEGDTPDGNGTHVRASRWKNHPTWGVNAWQAQVWLKPPACRDSTRGKAKFGKRHGSREWEEEKPSTLRLPRGKESKGQKTPSPPYNVPHPIGHPQGGLLCMQCSALADNALSVSKPIGGWGQYVVNTLLARCACLVSRSFAPTTRLHLLSCATRLSPTR